MTHADIREISGYHIVTWEDEVDDVWVVLCVHSHDGDILLRMQRQTLEHIRDGITDELAARPRRAPS
jgi:hypothetical protein